jgi:hypothetical protein
MQIDQAVSSELHALESQELAPRQEANASSSFGQLLMSIPLGS